MEEEVILELTVEEVLILIEEIDIEALVNNDFNKLFGE